MAFDIQDVKSAISPIYEKAITKLTYEASIEREVALIEVQQVRLRELNEKEIL